MSKSTFIHLIFQFENCNYFLSSHCDFATINQSENEYINFDSDNNF